MDVKTLCLGVLSFGDMAGYDIKKYLETHFGHFFLAGFGSIYPALSELDGEGLVAHTDCTDGRRPPKKVYTLTSQGQAALLEALSAETPRHKVRSEFLVLMYFAHLMPPAHVASVIECQLEQWRQRLREIEAFRSPGEDCPGVRFPVGYGETVLKAASDYLMRERPNLLAALENSPKRSDAASEEGACVMGGGVP